MLQPGQVISGRYQLASPIGEGAMGSVWRAQDQTLKRQVAIKFLFVRGTRDPQAMIDQFLREARIAASVQHRNVIQTVDFGTFDQWQPFMVMELLSGESLGDRLAREPPLTREQLIHIVSLTLRGLAAVHDAGIVHRDLKPQNIFLQRDSDAVYPKILDFGISRTLESKGERPSAIATQEGMIIGTPDYMSPEQARGEANIDKRSDIYSMGVILYEGLTGQLPFDAETVGDLIVQIVTQTPPPMREVAPDVPQSLSDMVAQAMSKSREHRFSDARAMRRALLAAAEAALPPGRRAAFSAPPPPPEAAGTQQHGGKPPAVPAFPPAPSPVAAALSPMFAPPPPPAGPFAPAAPGRGVTWGDFEGLNAPQIVDTGPPQEAGAAAGPKPQRIVAKLSDQLASVAPPRGELAAGLPSLEASGAGAGDRPSAARKAGKPQRKSAAGGSQMTAEDALDPLYAGANQAAVDIDYDRVRTDTRKSQTQVQPGVQPQPAARGRAKGAGSRTASRQQPPRPRYRRSYGAWLLPLAALALGWYVWTRPATQTGRAGAYKQPAAGLSAKPYDLQGSAQAAVDAARAATGAAGGDASAVVSPAAEIGSDKGRRANPGRAPAHMRDVVF